MSTSPATGSPPPPGDDDATMHRRALAREFFASALYVAIVLRRCWSRCPASSCPRTMPWWPP